MHTGSRWEKTEESMRKNLQKGFALCLAVCLLMLLTACGGYAQDLSGTWERVDAAVGTDGPFVASGGGFALVNAVKSCTFGGSETAKLYLLKTDGTERAMDIRYAVTDDTLTIDPHETEWSWGLGYELRDRGRTLVIDMGPQNEVTFRKAD